MLSTNTDLCWVCPHVCGLTRMSDLIQAGHKLFHLRITLSYFVCSDRFFFFGACTTDEILKMQCKKHQCCCGFLSDTQGCIRKRNWFIFSSNSWAWLRCFGLDSFVSCDVPPSLSPFVRCPLVDHMLINEVKIHRNNLKESKKIRSKPTVVYGWTMLWAVYCRLLSAFYLPLPSLCSWWSLIIPATKLLSICFPDRHSNTVWPVYDLTKIPLQKLSKSQVFVLITHSLSKPQCGITNKRDAANVHYRGCLCQLFLIEQWPMGEPSIQLGDILLTNVGTMVTIIQQHCSLQHWSHCSPAKNLQPVQAGLQHQSGFHVHHLIIHRSLR